MRSHSKTSSEKASNEPLSEDAPVASETGAMVEPLPWGSPASFPTVPVHRGALRNESADIVARTDAEAVAEWLKEKAGNSRCTLLSYRTHAERLLLWAGAQGKSLSDLDREDYSNYFAFLANPGPGWLSSDFSTDPGMKRKRWRRASENWRPFIDRPSPASAALARHIIRCLVMYLVDVSWFSRSPLRWPGRKPLQTISRKVCPLTESVCHYLWVFAHRYEASFLERERMIWFLKLFTELALSTSEVASLSFSDIECKSIRDQHIWVLNVIGRGKRQSVLPVPNQVVRGMVRFREALGLSCPLPHQSDPHVPFAPDLRYSVDAGRSIDVANLRSLSVNGVYVAVKRFITAATRALEADLQSGNEIVATLKLSSADALIIATANPNLLKQTMLKGLLDDTKDPYLVKYIARFGSLSSLGPFDGTDFFRAKTMLEHWSGVMRFPEPT